MLCVAVREKLGDPWPLGSAKRWLERFLAAPRERLTNAGSSSRFMAYEMDFWWGAPSRVEPELSKQKLGVLYQSLK